MTAAAAVSSSSPAQTVTRHAPGKLFLTGEYAVMEPGSPALLVAVDRLVSAAVSPAEAGVTLSSDLAEDPVRLRWRDHRLAGETEADERAARQGFSHVVAALEVLAELAAERGTAPPPLRLSIRSELHRDGTKLGLGSSGAVTVAVVAAAAAHCGLELPVEQRFRLALIASARLDPAGSGADLAASTWRGWICYRAPDRAAVLELVRRHGVAAALRLPWPGLAVRRLAAPAGLSLQVGWTGRAAQTRDLLADRRPWRDSAGHRAFVAAMTESVLAAAAALDGGDHRGFLDQIRSARSLLANLQESAGLGIFTDPLLALCRAAEDTGWAAKPSGAGGGDCGIALRAGATEADVRELHRRWAAAGIVVLPLRVVDGEAEPS